MSERRDLVEVVAPDTINVRIEHNEEVVAITADVYVTVNGSSFFTGEMALTKAREVSQLVTELKTMGIPDNDIHLEGVSAKVSSGVLGKSSSAQYAMRESMAQYASRESMARSRRITGSDLSIDMSHRELVSFAVDVEFLISRYKPSGAD